MEYVWAVRTYLCRKGMPEVLSNNTESTRTSLGFSRMRSNYKNKTLSNDLSLPHLNLVIGRRPPRRSMISFSDHRIMRRSILERHLVKKTLTFSTDVVARGEKHRAEAEDKLAQESGFSVLQKTIKIDNKNRESHQQDKNKTLALLVQLRCFLPLKNTLS